MAYVIFVQTSEAQGTSLNMVQTTMQEQLSGEGWLWHTSKKSIQVDPCEKRWRMSTVIEGGGPCYRTTTLPVSGQKTLPGSLAFSTTTR